MNDLGTVERLRKAEGIEIHIVDDQCVVYDTQADQVHYLNPTAALVLEFCDGNHSIEEIAGLVQQAYHLPEAPVAEVGSCLDSLKEMKIAG